MNKRKVYGSEKFTDVGIPFSGHWHSDLPTGNNKHRLKVYRKFMGVQDFEGKRVLDIGKPSYISRELKIADNTHGDLNWEIKSPRCFYDIIVCTEVVNHVMNPLLFLKNIHKLLAPGGKLYLATPRGGFWRHGRGNFTEYRKDCFERLMQYVGFKVVRYEVHNPWPWFFMFYGIRPPLRVLFNRFMIWEFRR